MVIRSLIALLRRGGKHGCKVWPKISRGDAGDPNNVRKTLGWYLFLRPARDGGFIDLQQARQVDKTKASIVQ